MTTIDIGLIELFDLHLHSKSLKYQASIIGGAAIMLVANGQRPTGDLDSIVRIPDEIKAEIRAFAIIRQISEDWFNDNASRNFHEFVMKGQEVFDAVAFSGKALTLHTPSMPTLLLSKFYPILDRPAAGKDLQDIESLLVAGVVRKSDFDKALEMFKDNIRFEPSKKTQSLSRDILKVLRKIGDGHFK